MKIEFGANDSEEIIFVHETWNDFGYCTLFTAYYSDGNSKRKIGNVSFATIKEAKEAYKSKKPDEWVDYNSLDYLPNSLEQSDDNIISLGNIEYYNKLYDILTVEKAKYILEVSNDIAYNLKILDSVMMEDVVRTSFLRGTSFFNVKRQLHRVANNGEQKISFSFSLKYSFNNTQNILKFDVDPNSKLPSNIYSIIGNNGTGKTTILQDIVKCYLKRQQVKSYLTHDSLAELEVFDDYENIPFESIVFISFSAFDQLKSTHFTTPNKFSNFKYIGNSTFIREENMEDNIPQYRQVMKNPIELEKDFESYLNDIKISPDKKKTWEQQVQKLSFDSKIFKFLEEYNTDKYNFSILSSGQKMIILALTGLISKLEEKTLVIIDEPESYLHPPLVSAYIRILSDLLKDKNGVAIISTHSPIIIQEVSKKCVYIIERDNDEKPFFRHPKSETFGENIGFIMDDIFGLDLRNTGYFKFLSELSDGDLHKAKSLLSSGQLGTEANLFLQIFLEGKN